MVATEAPQAQPIPSVSDAPTYDSTPPVNVPLDLALDSSLSLTARGLLVYLIATDEPVTLDQILQASRLTTRRDVILAMDDLVRVGVCGSLSDGRFTLLYEDDEDGAS